MKINTKNIRKELIKYINKSVDEHQCLGAENIADDIIDKMKLIKLSEAMLAELEAISDGTSFSKETGLIWKHRLEIIQDIVRFANEK